MPFEQVTVVGVGLIGGSVGLASRARGLAARVVGVGRDPKTLARAVELGAIDSFSTDLAAGVRDADLVVVCTPVDRIAGMILAAAPHVNPGTVFTDAGSTKQNILCGLAGKMPDNCPYVPAHPIAGAEKAGVEHARADLFQDRVAIVTPPLGSDSGALVRVEAFWEALGSKVVRMSPEEHDRVLASTSHLPHAVASGVAAATPVDYLPLSAGGFRDVTRIAAGDPGLWAAIFQANRDPVLSSLRVFNQHMLEFQRLLEAGDGAGLVRWLADAKQVRDAL
ncbi:cyclohexadienyl dehydrogenase : Prephenate dehydrogenase OS=Blastopirellula marina DSM 3645 GN=DSM3645_06204 PE=4 SV=1: PDH [Gemmataceae bacterium]|nr:cyclohexadienyl dehydrogenase : Prephenate dehydrogenase OS=Blastopirellula marina DSM 3645 GN=DSM3645_06204 PE=4 SV=1: PDH [Gemmataceae bacterium]VTU02687.1 cyclohexadienyl dehydrogenase : Prephenate dehydrogenase OS=Blastopirellula marina DSM 3645 GN=DSM3645_06204 PE=4 SV=1: PDH [Gemmataceae bacterium]